MKMPTFLQLRNSVNRSHVRPVLLLIPLACFALSPQARATCQDACLTNNNTVQGDNALLSLTTGHDNTASGYNALYFTTTGSANTATGSNALYSNTTGAGNTATGIDALYTNMGDWNTANGFNALFSNAIGNSNTAIGGDSLYTNTTGSWNTAIGFNALSANTSGSTNVAIGFQALVRNTTGTNNIAVGNQAGSRLSAGTDNIYIGNNGAASSESTHIRIGTVQRHTFIAGISGAIVADGVGVIVGADGHLGTVVSSERFKDSIKPIDKASEAILALKPVTFRYKHDLDPNGIAQFGLVAEEVEKVNPDLVARDDQGKAYTVRYEAVNAMLLNEFLKEHKAFLEERRTVEELKKQVGALTAGLQKVSAQLEASKSAPRTVLDDR